MTPSRFLFFIHVCFIENNSCRLRTDTPIGPQVANRSFLSLSRYLLSPLFFSVTSFFAFDREMMPVTLTVKRGLSLTEQSKEKERTVVACMSIA